VAFVIFPGQFQDTASAIEMLSGQVPLHPMPFADSRLPERSIWMWYTLYLVHNSSLLHPPIRVVSIHEGLSASAVTSPCADELFGDFAHHPAGFVIFAQLAQLYLFIIYIFPSLPIVRTFNITQTVTDNNNHLQKCLVESRFVNPVFLALFLLSCSF
jgi:hypothetical protein